MRNLSSGSYRSRAKRDGRRIGPTGGATEAAFRQRYPRIKFRDVDASTRELLYKIVEAGTVPDFRRSLLAIPTVVNCEPRKEQNDHGFVIYIRTGGDRGVSTFVSEDRLRASLPSTERAMAVHV